MSRGIPGCDCACAGYYARRFNVEVDPEREVIVTLGSKEGLANLAQAITAPGDIVLVPTRATLSTPSASSWPGPRFAMFRWAPNSTFSAN